MDNGTPVQTSYEKFTIISYNSQINFIHNISINNSYLGKIIYKTKEDLYKPILFTTDSNIFLVSSFNTLSF